MFLKLKQIAKDEAEMMCEIGQFKSMSNVKTYACNKFQGIRVFETN